MSPEQFIAVLGAIVAAIVALAGVYLQVRSTHALVNSRMGELLALTKQSAHAEGILEANAPQPPETPPSARRGRSSRTGI